MPGFVALFLIRRIAAIGIKPSEFDATVWSLFLSLIIYVPFSLTLGLGDIDVIRDRLFVPSSFVVLILYTLIVAGIAGFSLKIIRPGVQLGDAWERVASELRKIKGGYVIVLTANDMEYIGRVQLMGIEEDHREILLKDPIWIVRDQHHEVAKQIPIGKELLFTEGDIRRIVLFDELNF